jgi:uncharacterized OB-fold protein
VTAKTAKPAIEGWFTTDPDRPALLGSRCTTCGSRFFPRETYLCRNPDCDGRELEEVELGRRGTIWSFTNTCYQPPPPYVPTTDPFEPFTLAAVELADDKMVVLGQLVPGITVEDLRAGMEVELVLGTLYEDDDHEYLIWKWQPVAEAADERAEVPA